MAKPIDTDYELDDVLSTYRLDGSMLKAKARVLLEDWVERIYPRIQDETTPTNTLLDIGKVLIELGDMKPKNQVTQQASGPGFSITINIPQNDGKAPIVIEGSAQQIDPEDDDEQDTITSSDDEDAADTKAISSVEQSVGFMLPDFDLEEDDG